MLSTKRELLMELKQGLKRRPVSKAIITLLFVFIQYSFTLIETPLNKPVKAYHAALERFARRPYLPCENSH